LKRSPAGPRRSSNARRTIGCLFPCLLLLLAAGCGGEKTKKPDFSAPDIPGSDLVVLEVAGEPITAAEVYHKIRLQYPQMPQSGPALGKQVGEVVKQMLKERCLLKLGEERGYDQNLEFLRMMYLSRTYILTTETVNEEIWSKIKPTDAEVDDFYQQNVDRFMLSAKVWYHEILVDSEARAREVRERLLAGEDFAGLAARYSIDKGVAERGGEMPPYEKGVNTKLEDQPEVVRQLLTLEAQTVSAPVRTSRGWHILRVDARREERQRPLEEVRDEIRQTLTAKRETGRYTVLLDSLAQAYAVSVKQDALDRFYWLQMNDEQLFDDTRKEPDAGTRVRMYENLI
jgi:peptidyl-prolyl cis-trans isomerase C